MISSRFNSLFTFTAVTILSAASAFANVDNPDLAGPVVQLAAPPIQTRANAMLAPSSALTGQETMAMANRVAALSGRDIIVSRVTPTGSMKPFFDENALLLLEAVPFESLKLGDVVTYYHPTLKITVVHRLVEKRGDQFWSRGDHNSSMDNIYVTRENFQRRLAGVIYGAAPAVPTPPAVTRLPEEIAGTAAPAAAKPANGKRPATKVYASPKAETAEKK